MKSRLIILVSALLALSSAEHIAALSQTSRASTEVAPTAETKRVNSNPSADVVNGSIFLLAEFAESINARKLKPGDKVKAHVVQDVLSHGRIVVPEKSNLVGHVTEVKLRSKDETESRLGIVFDKVELGHHEELLFQAVVVALAPPIQRRSPVDEPDLMIPPAAMTGVLDHSSGMMRCGPKRALAFNQGAFSLLAPLTNTASATAQRNPSCPVDSGNFWAGTETQPMSAGMFGVHGIKNIALSQRPGSNTPGPLIVSSKTDVKLDYGTQVIVQVRGTTAAR